MIVGKVMFGEDAWVQLAFQFIPKVFSGVEAGALHRTLNFFHSNFWQVFFMELTFAQLHRHSGADLGPSVPVKTCYTIVWFQQFGEGWCIGVMVRFS